MCLYRGMVLILTNNASENWTSLTTKLLSKLNFDLLTHLLIHILMKPTTSDINLFRRILPFCMIWWLKCLNIFLKKQMIYFASTGQCWFFNHQLSWEYNDTNKCCYVCWFSATTDDSEWWVGGWVGGWGVNGPNIISGALFRQCYRDTIDTSPQSDYCRQRTWNPHVSLYWEARRCQNGWIFGNCPLSNAQCIPPTHYEFPSPPQFFAFCLFSLSGCPPHNQNSVGRHAFVLPLVMAGP